MKTSCFEPDIKKQRSKIRKLLEKSMREGGGGVRRKIKTKICDTLNNFKKIKIFLKTVTERKMFKIFTDI